MLYRIFYCLNMISNCFCFSMYGCSICQPNTEFPNLIFAIRLYLWSLLLEGASDQRRTPAWACGPTFCGVLGYLQSPLIWLLVVAARNTSLVSTTSLENCSANQQILYLHRALDDGVLVLRQDSQALCCQCRGIKTSWATFYPAECFSAFALAGIIQVILLQGAELS